MLSSQIAKKRGYTVRQRSSSHENLELSHNKDATSSSSAYPPQEAATTAVPQEFADFGPPQDSAAAAVFFFFQLSNDEAIDPDKIAVSLAKRSKEPIRGDFQGD